MSQIYFNWFMMCYNNEPPTVTVEQLGTALERGMLTQDEYDKIIQSKVEPVEEAPVEETPINETEVSPDPNAT